MEWIVGIYLLVGLVKSISKLGANPMEQPGWMRSQRNPLVWSMLFAFYVIAWPLQKG